MKKDKIDCWVNPEFFNTGDADDRDDLYLSPEEREELADDDTDEFEGVSSANLHFKVNMMNYRYMKEKMGLNDDEFEEWLIENG